MRVNNSQNINLTEEGGQYSSGRWTGYINNLNPGTHSVRLIASDIGNHGCKQSTSWFVVTSFEGLIPRVEMNDLVVDFATSTSTIPLSAYGEDFDGSFYSMQFYVDGQVYGPEIFRPSGIEQDLVNYSELLQLNSPGIYSIFAIGRDNSGNHVASSIKNLSATTGSTPAEIKVVNGPQVYTSMILILQFQLILR